MTEYTREEALKILEGLIASLKEQGSTGFIIIKSSDLE